MFASMPNEETLLHILQLLARSLSAMAIAILFLFLVGGGLNLSGILWEETGQLLLAPIGLAAGLILAWKHEIEGGTFAVIGAMGFYLVAAYILNESLRSGWWILPFVAPGLLFVLHGVLLVLLREGKGPTEHKPGVSDISTAQHEHRR